MPVSTSVHISHCLSLIIGLNPRSVLDVGCGFGMWGFLSREYLDVFNGRVQPDEWTTRIDGIEYFEPYIQPHQRAVYDEIMIGDIRDMVDGIDEYELIIAGDVIEHLDKADGESVLEKLYEKATRALLVNIPLGEGWDHPEQYGNPGELHRSKWSPEDFAAYPSLFESFQLPCGTYGSFYCPKDCSLEVRVAALCNAAEHADSQGDWATALRRLRAAHSLQPDAREVTLYLIDVLIRSGAPGDAATLLAEAVERDSSDHKGRVLLAKLLTSLSRRQEARACLEKLLGTDDVSQDILQEAVHLLETL